MRWHGVVYDVGRKMTGWSANWRPDYSPALVRRELEIIRTDLGANAVRLAARDPRRLLDATAYALDLGLHVWAGPELWNATASRTAAYLEEVAPLMEKVRRRAPDRLVFVVGNELTFFLRGIVPGRTHAHRTRLKEVGPMIRAGRHQPPLRAALADLVKAVRHAYDGPITYASLPFEQPDWGLFDIVSVNHYRNARSAATYRAVLDRLRAYGKPVAVTELGFAACTDADNPEFLGSLNVSPLGMAAAVLPGVGRLVAPRVREVHERDEPRQARLLTGQLADLERWGVDGAFVMSFSFPLAPYSPDPRRDVDATALSIVRHLGRGRGRRFPGLPWEPKESFDALAEYFPPTPDPSRPLPAAAPAPRSRLDQGNHPNLGPRLRAKT
ncbi:hypothetical protein [Hamadaea tsunoensis]|uniref:hypothetical protein n=1 Tax=Hamadaea tsunoensis TaxID=53368 RepID=UPI000422E08A|nr:hypothetical protein [Hamadaea tsunoensis]